MVIFNDFSRIVIRKIEQKCQIQNSYYWCFWWSRNICSATIKGQLISKASLSQYFFYKNEIDFMVAFWKTFFFVFRKMTVIIFFETNWPLKALNYSVVAVTEDFELLEKLGADVVLDHNEEDYHDTLKSVTFCILFNETPFLCNAQTWKMTNFCLVQSVDY